MMYFSSHLHCSINKSRTIGFDKSLHSGNVDAGAWGSVTKE